MTSRLSIAGIIPGGIRSTDRCHHETNDGTCSRCGKHPGESVPLMLWSEGSHDLWIFCDDCTGPEAWAAQATIAPRA